MKSRIAQLKITISLFNYKKVIGIWMALALIMACNSPKDKQEEASSEEEKEFTLDSTYTDEIDELTQDSLIETALEKIKAYDDETIENQIKLTEIEAPPFKEDKFDKPEVFADLLKEYGLDSVEIDSIGNVIARRKGTEGKNVIVLAGHLDTVFPEGTDVETKTSNDTIYAPGIGDDNRGLAAILTIVRVFNELDIKTKDDILFVADVGEEGLGDLRGMKHLFRDGGPQIDQFISIEPGKVSRITNGALGSHRYKATFKGPGGHSWGSFGLVNPIHGLSQAITEFVKKADEFTTKDTVTSYNVGRIKGGTSVNSIPYSVWAEVDMRSLNPESLEKIDTIFHQAMRTGLDKQNEMRRMGDSLKLDLKMIGDRPSGQTDPDQPLVQRAAATSLFLGEDPELGTSSTDSNVPISKGIPAITLGGGGKSGGAHSLDEWYLNKDGYEGIQRIFLTLTAQAGILDKD